MKPNPPSHPRTVGWFGTTAVAMGGINQSLFLLSALLIGQGAISGQGSAAVPILIAGLLLSWAVSADAKQNRLPAAAKALLQLEQEIEKVYAALAGFALAAV